MYFSRVRIKPDIRELSHLQHLLRGNGYGTHQLLFDLFPGHRGHRLLFREEIAGEQIPYYRGARGEPIYYVVSEIRPSKESPLLTVESKPYEPRLISGDRLSFKLRANPIVARKESGKENSVRHDVVIDAQRRLLHELAGYSGEDDAGKKSDLKRRILKSWLVSQNPEVTTKLKQIIEGNERYKALLEQRLPAEKLLDLALRAAADSALEAWLINKGTTNGFTLLRDEKRKRFRFQAEGYRWHALSTKGRTAGFSSVDFEGEIEVTNPDFFIRALFSGIGPAKGFGCGLMLVRRI